MTMRNLLPATLLLLLTASTAHAAETSFQLELGGDGLTDFQRHIVAYECGEDDPFSVTYINAAPNFLAIVPVEGEAEPLIFSAVLADAGARYAAGQWAWTTEGTDASLYDITLGEDAEAVKTCSEINNIP